MPSFDIIKEIKPKKSFRVASVMGKFDLQTEHIKERFIGNIEFNNSWQIGCIIGKSGTGKTTIAKQLFGDNYVEKFEYKNETILDDFNENLNIEEITKTFNSVGFSSPTSWLKPYCVLSNGEKMRVDLARAILDEKKMFVFDEYTSVVDRDVAKIGSFAMQKAIRKTNKKFIAVTCHFDIIDWLLPDWIFNTDTMTFQQTDGQKKNKPECKFEIWETMDKSIWKMFSKYHYLNSEHHNCARVFLGILNDVICGFISVFTFPSPYTKKIKKVHRLVVLPDYQGIGIGNILLNEVGKIFKNDGYRYTITTSTPALIFPLKNNKNWICTSYGRKKNHSGLRKKTWEKIGYATNKIGSQNRITTSWEMI